MRRDVILLALLFSVATSANAQENDKASTLVATAKAKPAPWEKFEAEFGLGENDPTLFRGGVRRAKYAVDLVTFSVTQFLADAEDALELQYKGGTVRRSVTSPSVDRDDPAMRLHAFDDTRLKFDLNLTAAARPYVGVRLVIPY